MAKEKNTTKRSVFFRELLKVGLYKRSQGKLTRQVTFAAAAAVLVIGVWRLTYVLGAWQLGSSTGFWGGVAQMRLDLWLPFALLFVGLWVAYRTVNVPRVADFLIAVEAEMNKVSWPSRPELIRSSLVVVFVVFALAAVLFSFDLVWSKLFTEIGILK